MRYQRKSLQQLRGKSLGFKHNHETLQNIITAQNAASRSVRICLVISTTRLCISSCDPLKTLINALLHYLAKVQKKFLTVCTVKKFGGSLRMKLVIDDHYFFFCLLTFLRTVCCQTFMSTIYLFEIRI